MGNFLIGMDEAGMGTLAGPMTAAIVVIEESRVPKGVRDSKKMTDASREEVAAKIMEAATFYKIVAGLSEDIDMWGISKVWANVMQKLAVSARHFLALTNPEYFESFIIIDGNRYVPGAHYVKPVVKADATHPAVSAASILAKYHQCGWMDDLDLLYPQYGFRDHRGYGTEAHMRALKEYGPCPVHRRSYRPIRKLLSSKCGS